MFKYITESLASIELLLGSSAWFRLAKRGAAMVCTVCSFLTSMFGAFEYFTENFLIGGLLCIGIQLGLYGLSHGAPDAKTRRFLTLSGWVICFCFSVYLSALGFYSKQFGTIHYGHELESVSRRWETAQGELRRVQAEARGWIQEALDKKNGELEREQRRVDWRRGKGLAYSTAGVTRLKSEAAALEATREQLNKLSLNAVAPEDPAKARENLQLSFTQTAAAYDSMPQTFRDTHKGPTLPQEETVTREIQASFFEEIKRGSKPVLVVLIVAMLLDLLPVLLLQSEKSVRNKAEQIRQRRLAQEEIRLAQQEDLRLFTRSLRVVVEGPVAFDGVITFGSDERVLYPEDLTANFDDLAETLSAKATMPLQVVSATTNEGMELIPGIPLVSQLGDSRVVRLRAVTATVEAA